MQFVGQLVRFDLGVSFISRQPVAPDIGDRLAVTLPLTFLGFALALLIAIPLGIIAGVRSDRWYGALISTVSQLGVAVPVFWIGILLVAWLAVDLRFFPSGGFPRRGWENIGAALYSLALPAITIGMVMAASLLRYVRSAVQDVVGSDYLRNARALGESFSGALLRHGLRNAAAPVVSIMGIELATAFLGAVVVERVFSLPGLGSMLLLGIDQRDFPSIQGVLIVSTLLVLIVGFVADLLQRLIDPRVRDRAAGRPA